MERGVEVETSRDNVRTRQSLSDQHHLWTFEQLQHWVLSSCRFMKFPRGQDRRHQSDGRRHTFPRRSSFSNVGFMNTLGFLASAAIFALLLFLAVNVSGRGDCAASDYYLTGGPPCPPNDMTGDCAPAR